MVSAGTLIATKSTALPDGGNLTIGSWTPGTVPAVAIAPPAASEGTDTTSCATAADRALATYPAVRKGSSVAARGATPWWAIAEFLTQQQTASQPDDRRNAVDTVMRLDFLGSPLLTN